MHRRVLLAVDGNSLVHRAFHAQSSAGIGMESNWAVRGLLTQLVAAVERVGADSVLVGFDDPRSSSRRETWPQYKANRGDKPAVLISQLLLAASVLRELGVCVVTPAGLEADDVLCSAAAYARTVGADAVIMTSDRDSFALIDETTRVLRIINGGVEASPLLTCERLFTMLGVRPDQYRDFAALRGDPSDNLPGVTGIGPKTAARLLARLDTAEAAFADLAAGGDRVRAAIGAGAAARLSEPQALARWRLNCQVMRMHPDLALGLATHGASGASGASGAGGTLPLTEAAVRTIFSEHRLIATLPTALRVLAHREAGPGVVQAPPVFSAGPDPDRYRRSPRLPKLVKRAGPRQDQLVLF